MTSRGFARYGKHKLPIFESLTCAECGNKIRSNIFSNSRNPEKIPPFASKDRCLCETCYWKNHYGDEAYLKRHKYCILPEAMDTETSKEVCQCPEMQGVLRNRFPVESTHRHSTDCSLLKLNDHLATAKIQAIPKYQAQHMPPIRTFNDIRPIESTHAMGQQTLGFDNEELAEEQIPLPLRKYANQWSFGNVHMALRIGPLRIESGVPGCVVHRILNKSES